MNDWRIEVAARALHLAISQRTKQIYRRSWDDLGEPRRKEYLEEAAAVVAALDSAEAHR